jgi:hypothetical protein
LYDRLKVVIQGSGFHSVTEFAVYVLRDLVSHHAAGGGIPGIAGTPAPPQQETEVDPLNPQEIEAIRQRLESLGYL